MFFPIHVFQKPDTPIERLNERRLVYSIEEGMRITGRGRRLNVCAAQEKNDRNAMRQIGVVPERHMLISGYMMT